MSSHNLLQGNSQVTFVDALAKEAHQSIYSYQLFMEVSMEQSHIYHFEESPIPHAVLFMSGPLILSMFVGVVYGIADSAFVGLLGSPDKIASVVLALPVLAFFMGLANIFGIGCGSYISRLLGEKDLPGVRAVSAFAFWATLATGIVATLGFFCFLEPLLHVLGTTPATINDTRSFVRVLAGGGAVVMLSFALSSVVRAEGASKEAMVGMLLGTLVTLVFDPIFIFGLELGVTGAAWATLIGNALSVVYYMWYLLCKSPHLSIRPSDFQATQTIIKESLAIGTPVFLTGLLLMVSALIMNNYSARYGGTMIAVMGIAIQVNNVPQFLIAGLCEGVTTMGPATVGA
jgi:multidrug efflux pump